MLWTVTYFCWSCCIMIFISTKCCNNYLSLSCLLLPVSWAGDSNKMADACPIETVFCWNVCTPQTWSPEMQRNFYVIYFLKIWLCACWVGDMGFSDYSATTHTCPLTPQICNTEGSLIFLMHRVLLMQMCHCCYCFDFCEECDGKGW
jgi:hypothetical protein